MLAAVNKALKQENNSMEGLDSQLKSALARITELEKTKDNLESKLTVEVEEKVSYKEELDRVKDEAVRMEKEREQEQQAYQQMLRKYHDTASKLHSLEQVLQQLEKELQEEKFWKMNMETDLRTEILRLKADNDRQQNLLAGNLKSPSSQNEIVLQHEVHRLTQENLECIIQDPKDISPHVDMVASIRKNYLGMLEYQSGEQHKIIRAVVWELKPLIAVHHLPGLPAYIIFMCIRYTDRLNDDNKVRVLLTDTITMVKKLMRKKGETDLEVSVFWLSNVLRLLHTLKQYSGDAMFQADNTPKQNEQSLENFDLSKYRQVLSDDIAVWIYTSVIKLLEDKMQPLIVPAILENDSGLTSQVTVTGSKSRSMSVSSEHGGAIAKPLETLSQQLDFTLNFLGNFGLDPEVIQQVYRQLFYYICAGALNNLLLRKDLCHWSKGMQIRYNISMLEEWCREKKMSLEVVSSLQPIIQASELLQARKAEKYVKAMCDMCDALTINQVIKLLTLYTPADEHEERLPISFIGQVQNRLQELRKQGSELFPQSSNLLMDTKFSFAVKFPFNPSNIRLEDIEIPEAFNISHLVKRL